MGEIFCFVYVTVKSYLLKLLNLSQRFFFLTVHLRSSLAVVFYFNIAFFFMFLTDEEKF